MSSQHMAAATHDDTSSAGIKGTESPPDQPSDRSVGDQLQKSHLTTNSGFAAVNGAHSHPMTATPSTSTLPDNADLPTSSSSTPAPNAYGTRSRNRGSHRPNYAEDHDIDRDLEVTSSKNNASKRASTLNQSSNRTSTPLSEPERPEKAEKAEKPIGVSTRRLQAVINSSTKEPIPGTSTFSANPNVASGTRKRKQPGANQTVQGSSTPNGTTTVKKFVAAASHPQGARVSNMMTFNNSRGYLKNGKLRADDGTVLAPNGTLRQDRIFLPIVAY